MGYCLARPTVMTSSLTKYPTFVTVCQTWGILRSTYLKSYNCFYIKKQKISLETNKKSTELLRDIYPRIWQ